MQTPKQLRQKDSITNKLPDQTPIVSNAARLLKDAKLLADNERFASAFALAVLALEEIGKVVLTFWDASTKTPKSKNRLSSHLKKQSAVSSLLLAKYTTSELNDTIHAEPMTNELIERVARAMSESEAGRFDWLVSLGAVDKTKQIGFYHDDWLEAAGLHADQFEASDVTQVFEKCRAAIAALGDSKTMHVGKAIYATRNS
jgi:AbiV family abortive infection protein